MPSVLGRARRRHAPRLGVRRVRSALAPAARHLPAVRVARPDAARPRAPTGALVLLDRDPPGGRSGVRAGDPVHRGARRARRRHPPLRPHRRRRPRRPARRVCGCGWRSTRVGDAADLVLRASRVMIATPRAAALRRRRLVGRVDARGTRVRQHAVRPARRDRGRRRDHRRARHLQPSSGTTRAGSPRSSVTTACGRGDVVSVQLPNWYETVAVDLGVLALGAVLNPLLPNYRARELAPHPAHRAHRSCCSRRTSSAASTTPRSDATLHDVDRHARAPRRRARARATSGSDVLGRDARAPRAGDRSRRRSREVIFTSGTEATPKGVMHTEHTTNCNVRSAYAVNELGPRRRRVDAEPDRPLHRPQLRRPPRPLLRAASWCCRTAGTPTAPSS